MQGFIEVGPNTFILDPRYGPDTQAVMGAKSSRAPDLAARWDELIALLPEGTERWDYTDPPEPISKFISQNLGEYGHSSIAELAGGCWVHSRGFGWPSAWLIEDFPLFVGQEMSTRAVDPTLMPGLCDFCPPEFSDIHDRWVEVFATEREREKGKKGYKFDLVRWALPGSVRTGVTLQTQARNAISHLRNVQGLLPELAERYLKGYGAVAPTVTKHYAKGPRPAHWHWGLGHVRQDYLPKLETSIDVASYDMLPYQLTKPYEPITHDWPDREAPRHYLDPIWERFSRVLTRIRCSVAVARDWHRHRPVMPWTLQPVTTEMRGEHVLAPSPWYWGLMEFLDTKAGWALWRETSRLYLEWEAAHNGPERWLGLHALPFGAMVKLECVGTLPKVLYMLELRATTKGANFEYKVQAVNGLVQLGTFLGESLRNRLRLPEAIELAQQVEFDQSVELALV